MNKYKEAATVLKELFDKGQEVIDGLCPTEAKNYLNKKEINYILFKIQPLEYIEEIVDSVIDIVEVEIYE